MSESSGKSYTRPLSLSEYLAPTGTLASAEAYALAQEGRECLECHNAPLPGGEWCAECEAEQAARASLAEYESLRPVGGTVAWFAWWSAGQWVELHGERVAPEAWAGRVLAEEAEYPPFVAWWEAEYAAECGLLCRECKQAPAVGTTGECAECGAECTACPAGGLAPVHWCTACRARRNFEATAWARPVSLRPGVSANPATECVRRPGVHAPEEWCAECQAWARA